MFSVVGVFNFGNAQNKNYAKSKENWSIRFEGYIQFVPNYKIPKNAGYGLKKGKYVKRAYINYLRNGKLVFSSGRQYTITKTSGSSVVSKSVGCWDDIRWGDKYTTKFYYGWYYK